MPKICRTWDEFQFLFNNTIYPPKKDTDLFLANLYLDFKNNGYKDLFFPESNIHFISLIKWYFVFASQSHFAINLSSHKFDHSPIFPSPFFSDDARLINHPDLNTVGIRFKPVSFFKSLLKYSFLNVSTNMKSFKSNWKIFLKDIFSGNWMVCIDPNALSLEVCSESGRVVLFLPPDIFFSRRSVVRTSCERFLKQFEWSTEHTGRSLDSNGIFHFRRYSNFWLRNLCERLEGISVRGFGLKYVMIGRQCSNPYAAILAHYFRRNGVTVVTFDHGSGNAHHAQVPVHWVEYLNSDIFVTTNSFVASERQRQFSTDYVFDLDPTEMIGKNCFIRRLSSLKTKKQIKPIVDALRGATIKDLEGNSSDRQQRNDPRSRINLAESKVLYIGTAFHGWRQRLRPINSDGEYFKWQVILLNVLSEKAQVIHYRPHPEGATKPPTEQMQGNKVEILTDNFDTISLGEYDLIIFDFIFSSVMPKVFKAGVPLLFFNTGYPELTNVALNLIKSDVNYVKVNLDEDFVSLTTSAARSLRSLSPNLTGAKMLAHYFDFNAD